MKPVFAGIMVLMALFYSQAAAVAESAGRKKVLILPIKNFDQNPGYAYLEESITEAIRSDLGKKFEFVEPERAAWEDTALKQHFLWPD